jgi:hypothetical protein
MSLNANYPFEQRVIQNVGQRLSAAEGADRFGDQGVKLEEVRSDLNRSWSSGEIKHATYIALRERLFDLMGISVAPKKIGILPESQPQPAMPDRGRAA